MADELDDEINDDYEDGNVPYEKTNRERKKAPKRGRGWCVCDMALVENGRKCPVCGRMNGIKRFKKDI